MKNDLNSPLSKEPVYLEENFCRMATSLRSEFEERISGCHQPGAGMTPLMYVFCRDAYCLLTATAERIFSQDLLEGTINILQSWASETLGADHASTPQLRAYVNGCGRALLRDGVSAKWHYLLSLSDQSRKGVGKVKVLAEEAPSDGNGREMGVGRILSFRMDFNRLLVHAATMPYGVEMPNTSMHPQEGTVLLEGYFW
jgi:hypothetical protein